MKGQYGTLDTPDHSQEPHAKMRLRLKIILGSPITKVVMVIITTLLLAIAIILPSVLSARKPGELIAFNRDATSGTREAFVEKVLGEDPDTFSPGKNVLEASNNESMIRNAKTNKYSVSYVSFGTVAEFDVEGNIIMKEGMDRISVSNFEGVEPNRENILNGTYGPTRNFNEFFRVEKDSVESNILDYDFETNSISKDVSSLSDNLKASYFFYYWTIYSEEAKEIINNGSEIALEDVDRIAMNKTTLEKYVANTNMDSEIYRIEIVGSSSATATMELLANSFEEEVESEYGNVIDFVFATNGSGDAFKTSIAGAEEAYIGMQSREASESELESWGWTTNDVYHAFAKDAILIIFNNEGDDISSEIGYYTTDAERMDRLYTSNETVKFDEVFYHVEGGEF